MIFKDITTVSKSLQLSVLQWRNHINIRKNMYTDSIIEETSHLSWIDSLANTTKAKVYIAYKDDKAIGVASINNINLLHKYADWAFYLNPEFLTAKGLGTLMEYHFLNHIFENFDVKKLNCEVLETNPSVITLHKKFGFTKEGIRRQNIIKDTIRIDVHLLGILQEEWFEKRDTFMKIIERLER